MLRMNSSLRHRRGFTLTELTIVLGVIGVLATTIWVAAAMVSENNGVNRVNQQVIRVAQNIRDQYASVQSPPSWAGAGSSNLTSILDTLQLFPVEMRRSPTAAFGSSIIDHALYNSSDATSVSVGSVAVLQPSPGTGVAPHTTKDPACGAVTCFRITLRGLQQSSCIKLVEAIPVADASLGIVEIGVANNSGANTSCTGSPTTCVQTCTGTPCLFTGPVPVTGANSATSWCDGTAGDNILFIDFKLHN